MTDEALLPLIGFMLVAAVDWVAVGFTMKLVEYVAKPLALVLLIDVALTIEPADSAQRGWFVAALIFCVVGDVLLMLPKQRFVEGLSAFLLGHLCFIVGFAVAEISIARVILGVVIMLGLGGLAAWPLLRPVGREHRGLLVPVVAYMVVISTMVAFAGASGVVVALVGAMLFWASDYLIGWTKFVAPMAAAPVLIMVTYHLGQLGLVWSLTV